MTEDEIVESIKRSRLPTILVEGTDDSLRIYRMIESRLGIFAANVLPCHGRSVLLAIYLRRNELAGKKVVWIADRDMWRFREVPEGYEDVIFTSGYSIENDLIAGSEIESLFEGTESSFYAATVRNAMRWFAFEVEEFLADRKFVVDLHIRKVMNADFSDLSEIILSSGRYCEPDQTLLERLISDHQLSLRGKNLLQIFAYILSAPKRASKYSSESIVEICCKLFPDNPHIGRIVDEIRERLGVSSSGGLLAF